MNEFQITTRPVKDGGRGLGGGDWGGIGVVFVDARLMAFTVQYIGGQLPERLVGGISPERFVGVQYIGGK